MSRHEDYILKCAIRMVDKYKASKYFKLNGEYPKEVKAEMERMIGHCIKLNETLRDK